MHLGSCFFRRLEVDVAWWGFSNAISLDKTNIEAVYLMAKYQTWAEDDEKALTYYKKAVQGGWLEAKVYLDEKGISWE